ncbi:hypothetical protein D030_3229A, partial [Vibrio parahaemolyticus AQ3810]
MQHTILCIKSS